MTRFKKITLHIVIVSIFLATNLYAESWKFNPHTNKLDKVNDKASEIKVDEFSSFFNQASPATVQSALEQLAASYPIVLVSPYYRLDGANTSGIFYFDTDLNTYMQLSGNTMNLYVQGVLRQSWETVVGAHNILLVDSSSRLLLVDNASILLTSSE